MISKASKAYNKWTPHDLCLRQLVAKQQGKISWNKLSFQMSKIYNITQRSGKQCRERWISDSNSHHNKKPWLPEDDAFLFKQQKKFGSRWSQLAKCFSGRTDGSIKNRFFSKIKKALRRMSKYLNLKTATKTMYQLKPNTIIQIFKKGQADTDEYDPREQQDLHTLNQFKQVVKIIFSFMDNNPDDTLTVFAPQKIEQAVRKILQLHHSEELLSGRQDKIDSIQFSDENMDGQQKSQNYHLSLRDISQKEKRRRDIKKENINQERMTDFAIKQDIDSDYSYIRNQRNKKEQMSIKTELEEEFMIKMDAEIKPIYNQQIKIKTQALDQPYIFNFGERPKQYSMLELSLVKVEQKYEMYEQLSSNLNKSNCGNDLRCKQEEIR